MLIFLLLMASIPSGAASGSHTVDLEKVNKELDKALEKEFADNPLPYDPEIVSFEKIATLDEANQISKYLMKIRVNDGEYGIRSITFIMKDNLEAKDFKGLTSIFAGQQLSGKGGYYSADYSDIEGAKRGFVLAAADRGEVEIPTDADANAVLKDQGVVLTTADYFVEIAASHLVISDLLGIPVDKIDTSVIGHSLGGFFLALYGSSDYQDIPIGHINHAIFVDVIINYDSENENLRLDQVENYNNLVAKFNSGQYSVDGMKTSIFMAQQVENGVPGAHTAFDVAVSETYRMKALMGEKPPTPDYHYWPADCDTDLIVDKILAGAAVPYSSLESELYMTGVMAGLIPMGNLRGFDSISYIYFEGGFGAYGEDWFKNQGAEIYYGGNSGHGFMFNKDSAANWDHIWTYLEDQHQVKVSMDSQAQAVAA